MATTTKKAPAKKAPAKKAVAKKVASPKKEMGALEATMYTTGGKEAGTVSLPAELFGAAWNADLVHQVVIGMQANARPTVANTKFRGEVRGGGKKPWKQKGTGRARHGSRRSPIWVGGGTTHGPRAERDYSVKINKKMRATALASVLSKKWKDGEVLFVDTFSFTAPKTADAKSAIAAIALASGKGELVTKRKNAAVIALSKKDVNTEKSLRNFKNYETIEARNLNPVDLVTKKYLVIENPTTTFETLKARLAK